MTIPDTPTTQGLSLVYVFHHVVGGEILFDFDHTRHFGPTTQGLSLWCFNIVGGEILTIPDTPTTEHSGVIRETWGFLYDLVGFPIRYVSYCILMYVAVYLDVSRSYTLRYTKIHQDTSRYICIYLFGYHGNVSYLGVFTIHLGYI